MALRPKSSTVELFVTQAGLLVSAISFAVACGSPAKSSGKPSNSEGGSAGSSTAGGSSGEVGGTTGAGGSDAGGSTAGGSAAGGSGGMVATGTEWVHIPSALEGGGACSDISMVKAKPDEDLLYVALWQGGMWVSSDGGVTATKLGTGAGSDDVSNGPVTLFFDPADTNTFYESGMYGPAAYRTTDKGTTFERLGTIEHVDVMSIDFTDSNRMTLLAGAHEQSQKLYLSTDAGANWTDIGPNLPDGTSFSSFPWVIDSTTFLEGCSGFGDADTGVYRSTDAGATWDRVNTQGAHSYPLVASDGTLYWPIIYNRGLLKSTDSGATWTQVVASWNLLTTMSPIELPDQRLAALSGDGDSLPRHVMISADGAKTWTQVGPDLPAAARGLTYSAQRKAFFSSQEGCDSGNGGLLSLTWDYETN
jgi:hypothetical protein